jgi:hypothetical protein
MSVKISSSAGGRFSNSSVLKGTLDASLAANLPASPISGDRYRVTTEGTFEDDASILPAGSFFSAGDQIEWDGVSNFWIKIEAGDNISDSAFGPSWDSDANNAPSKNAVYDKATAQDATQAAHEADVANPHAVTQTQVGLSNVDNTSDVNKPTSTQQLADMKKWAIILG